MDALRDTLSVAPREYVVAAHRNLSVAIKRLRRAPAFTLTAIATLALGTGATASVFGLLNSVILRPLPWRSPERVGLVWATQPSGARTWLSFEEFEWAQRDVPSFASVAGMMDLRLHYAHDDSGDEVQALAISHDFLTTLGVAPAIGRDFAREDDRPTAARVVLLSDAFWR